MQKQKFDRWNNFESLLEPIPARVFHELSNRKDVDNVSSVNEKTIVFLRDKK